MFLSENKIREFYILSKEKETNVIYLTLKPLWGNLFGWWTWDIGSVAPLQGDPHSEGSRPGIPLIDSDGIVRCLRGLNCLSFAIAPPVMLKNNKQIICKWRKQGIIPAVDIFLQTLALSEVPRVVGFFVFSEIWCFFTLDVTCWTERWLVDFFPVPLSFTCDCMAGWHYFLAHLGCLGISTLSSENSSDWKGVLTTEANDCSSLVSRSDASGGSVYFWYIKEALSPPSQLKQIKLLYSRVWGTGRWSKESTEDLIMIRISSQVVKNFSSFLTGFCSDSKGK